MGWNYLSIPKLQRCNRWSLGMDEQFHSTLYWACNKLSMLGLKLNHVSKRGYCYLTFVTRTCLESLISWQPNTKNAFKYHLFVWFTHGASFLKLNNTRTPVTSKIIITVKWWRVRWCIKSPAYRVFAKPFVQTQIKENIKDPSHLPLWGESIPLTMGQ